MSVSSLAEKFPLTPENAACKQRAISRQRCRLQAIIALPHESRYLRDRHAMPCVTSSSAISHSRLRRDRCAAARVASAATRMRARPRRDRHRSCTASCSSASRPKDSSRTARRSPMRYAKSAPAEIMRRYAAEQGSRGLFAAGLRRRQLRRCRAPSTSDFQTAPREEIRAHIDRLWPALTRAPQNSRGADSLLPLSTRYVVPGGRFRELYYWDSYFTMVGLQTSGRDDLVADMVENFAGLIDRYGHIPNGSRSYYLSRSQPPFFAAMVELQAEHEGERALIRRLPQLEREYRVLDGGRRGSGSRHRAPSRGASRRRQRVESILG